MKAASDRIVIAGDLLTGLLDNLGDDAVDFSLWVSEFHTDRDALTGRVLPDEEPYALDFVQHNQLRILFTLAR